MNKRNLATVLWFLAGWSCGSLLAGLYGYPTYLGLLVAIPAAALIRWDPLGTLWSKPKYPVVPRRVVGELPADQAPSGALGSQDTVR